MGVGENQTFDTAVSGDLSSVFVAAGRQFVCSGTVRKPESVVALVAGERFAATLAQLEQRIAELEDDKKGKDKAEVEALETRIQAMQSRIFMIEFWGDRVQNKLAFQVTYSFNVNGPQKVHDPRNLLGGKVAERQPWPVTFWMGSWDGDLLVGWMQGSLSVPFEPDRS